MPRRQSRNRVQVYVSDKDRGFRRLASDLGGVTEIRLGVFGAKAKKRHADSDLSVGTVAAMHELGLGGMTQRSFVRAWMDANTATMLADAKMMLHFIMLGGSRKEAGEHLGKKWSSAVRSFIDAGKVRPLNHPATVARKGHDKPMLGLTGQVRDAVTYLIKLPTTKTMRGTVKNAAKRAMNGLISFNVDE